MDLLTILTVLVVVSAAFSYLNVRFIKLPGTIGVMTIAVSVSLIIMLAGKANIGVTRLFEALAHGIDFSKVLLDVMLGLLLFASALHFDYLKLKEQRLPVLLLSTLGVLVSTGVFGGLFYGLTKIIHIEVPLVYCLVFGSLISPTDPIAVAAILKKSKIPPRLNTIISGESLFNDGVGLVLFIILLEVADPALPDPSIGRVIKLFAQEIVGGVSTGFLLGYVGYRLIRSIKDFQTILLISIALVLGISVFAGKLHVSIPLAAVTAGLLIGNKIVRKQHVAGRFLPRIWQLIDEVLNTILFVMIGFQLATMPFLNNYLLVGLASIFLILIARVFSISIPAIFLLRRLTFPTLSILTWAGLRGGISIAMALSLPNSPYREIILASCYFIVLFSIIVQGLTLNKVVETAVSRLNKEVV